MIQALQPVFKIRVYKEGCSPSGGDSFKSSGGNHVSYGDSTFMDVEECAEYNVVYEEQASLLNTLTFTVDKFADVLLYRFKLGQYVVLYGGYYDSEGAGVRKVFSGTITRITTQFPDNGLMKFSVEAMSIGYTQYGKDSANNFSYPDRNSSRTFAKGKTSITLRELIVGIVSEGGMTLGELTLPTEVSNLVFTERAPRWQKNMSDWKFLTYLADTYRCFMWTDNKDGKEVFNFVDKKRTLERPEDRISFLYPLQGTSVNTSVESSEIIHSDKAEWTRPRLLRNVTVDEDISMGYAVTRVASWIDKTDGTEHTGMSEVTEEQGKKVVYLYELDSDRVKAVEKSNPELAQQIRSTGSVPNGWCAPGALPKDDTPYHTRYYYKTVKQTDENTPVFDSTFFGIYVTATCNQDLNIRSQRSYNIRGLLRYRSDARSASYLLRGLKHVWGKEGCTTELEFIF